MDENSFFLILTVGEECVFNMDCQYERGYCNESICAYNKTEEQNVLSFTGEFKKIASLTLTCLTHHIIRDLLAFRSLIFLNKKFRALETEPKSSTFM